MTSTSWIRENMPNVYRFTSKLLDVFTKREIMTRQSHLFSFSRKDEHKKKMENAIFVILELPGPDGCTAFEKHQATRDLQKRMQEDIEKMGGGEIILSEIARGYSE